MGVQAMPIRPTCQMEMRPRMVLMVSMAMDCMIAPRVMPARPLIFCGLSESVGGPPRPGALCMCKLRRRVSIDLGLYHPQLAFLVARIAYYVQE